MRLALPLIVATFSIFGTFANAAGKSAVSSVPAAVSKAASDMKNQSRTIISKYNVATEDANPCVAAGDHYVIKLQVKKQVKALDANEDVIVKDVWVTVQKRDVDSSGRIALAEICME